MSGELMKSSYTQLFGPIDHEDGAEARSVLSPAAYLVDLLQLRDSLVTEDALWTAYHARRPDVRDIPLDQANTFTEIPYLDVANQVMGNLVTSDELTSNLFPPPLPFSEQHLRARLYAEKLGTSLDEIQRLYREAVDTHVTARLRLGLSEEEYLLFSSTHDTDDEIRALWGVTDLATLNGSDVELIKKKLGLSLKELKQLVRQNLADSEQDAAKSFFINDGASYIILVEEDDAAPKLQVQAPSTRTNLENQHLDRMMRFVRLARRLDLEFAELDWLIQTACGNTLDTDGLQSIAIAIGIRTTSDWPMDEICSLWSVPKRHGRGDDLVPADLFDRVYNNDFPAAQSLQALVNTLVSNKGTVAELNDRFQAVLRLSGADFAFLRAALVARGVKDPVLTDAAASYEKVVEFLSGLRRIARLSTMLSLRVKEMVMLLDVLGAQWAVSKHEDLAIPMPFTAALASKPLLDRLLAPDAPPRETLDVLAKLIRLKEWLDLRKLSVRQLAFICIEDHATARHLLDDGSPIDDVQTDDDIETALDDLHESLLDSMVTPSALRTGSLTADGARAVFDSLVAARVLVSYDPARALLRVLPTKEELIAAMKLGIHERLEVRASDLAALGITDLEQIFSLLVSHGYLERVVVEVAVGEEEVHYFVAPGLEGYFSEPENAASFTVPSFEEHDERIFTVLAESADLVSVPASVLAETGIDESDVTALLEVLLARGYVELLPDGFRVAADMKAFFGDRENNLASFVLPNFKAAFTVLAAKVAAWQRAQENSEAEANEVGERLSASSEQQVRAWLRNLSGLIGLSEDVTELAFSWAFGTPDETMTQTLATLTLPLFAAKAQKPPKAALSDAYLASRFRRLQQLALLLRKTAMSADEARVYLENQKVREQLPETLKLPGEFPELLPSGESSLKIDALTALPNGDFLVLSGVNYATFSQNDYRLLSHGELGHDSDGNPLASGEFIPGIKLPDSSPDDDPTWATGVLASGFDAAFADTGADGKPVLHLCADAHYVAVSQVETADGSQLVTSPVKAITDWGKVRNNIQDNQRVDAAVETADGGLVLFSGDQYFRYSKTSAELLRTATAPAYVDERYPKSIREKFGSEGISPLPAMFSKVDAAFRDTDGKYYFFSGNRFTNSDDPYNPVQIRPSWGHVLNYLFEQNRVDAAFRIGDDTYLTRGNQLTRYSGTTYQLVDETFPILFEHISESELLLPLLRRFSTGVDAAFVGADGQLYAFKDGKYASSAAPEAEKIPIKDHWGRVRNDFVANERVDAAFVYDGRIYLFCNEQYVRYSDPDQVYVDEGYPKLVTSNWDTLENIGSIPATLQLPITAVVVGQPPDDTSDEVYFFGSHQYARPDGTCSDINAHWARVRNNIETSGTVDASIVDGSGRMYLFSGNQYYRYSDPTQDFVDETYPRRLSGNWEQEGIDYSLPLAFADGISAALRTDKNILFFARNGNYARVDGSPPTERSIKSDWGLVRNWIQSNNRVGAAFVDPSGKTYLFGGDQFVRYSGSSYEYVDEGYPLTFGTRWGLPVDFSSDIDAALSFKSPVDNVQRLYLFKGTNYVRYSTSDYTHVDEGYPKPLADGVNAEGLWFRGLTVHEPNPNSSHMDDGILAVEATYVDTYGGQPRICVFYRHSGGVQWKREYRNGEWLAPVRVEDITEYASFTRLDAAFVAADGTLYVFSGEQYASRPPSGGSLSAPDLIKKRWARVSNQFADQGRVDACLNMGTDDGRTYLFCANQYIKYTGTLRPGDTDFYVDEGYPKRIDPNWSGEGIPVALAPEFPKDEGYDLCLDARGTIHYFAGARYLFHKSDGTAGDVLLTSRWGKVENRFKDLNRVDGAYRAENDKLYLFCDTQYTRYSGALAPSTEFYADEGYPRRITTGWESEGLGIEVPAQWQALGSAIFRDAERTYVFWPATSESASYYTTSESATHEPVIPTWANVRNQMQSENRVDAGFVLQRSTGAVTYLFCADQYVRYSGPTYDGYVDEGYPKLIANLPAADGVVGKVPSELLNGVRAVFIGSDGRLHAFGPPPEDEAKEQRYVFFSSLDSDLSALGSENLLNPELYDFAIPSTAISLNKKWGIVENKLWDNEFVNAAVRSGDTLYLFSGDQYVRYSLPNREHVDEGYPRKMASYKDEIGAAELALILQQEGVEAAVTISTATGATTFYFAQGGKYIGTDAPSEEKLVSDRWGLVDNQLQTNQKLDAAFVAPNGKLYLFAGSQYSVYSGADRQYVDEEFPRTIVTDIGAHWPADFQSDLQAAAVFENRSYLFKGTDHVRISDFRLLQPDAGYPRPNAGKWVDRYDFELGTLPSWWRLKQLFDDYSSQTTTLLDYLDNPPEDGSDPVKVLALATQWPEDEIRALLSNLKPQPLLTDGLAVDRLASCFALSDRLGTIPSKLKSQIWDKAFGSSLQTAADFLYGLVKAATDPKDWPGVARSLLDSVQSAKRDALLAYLVESLSKRDANELYEYLLTDVQKDASSTTSRIVEAISSIQLYYHRALIQLEDVPEQLRKNLKSWWPWMKNYRIWEANRKVFLHPENYIRPELRTEKSPAFEELEEKLLQDDITNESVENAYQRYLESFNEISRLRIVGGYRYQVTGKDEQVVMIGLSRSEPPVYHYRFGELDSTTNEIDWDPWQKLGITVKSDRVQPVYAFNRLFIFWIETQPYNDTSFSPGGTYNANDEASKKVKLTIKYSFYNFNKEWAAPQTVKVHPNDPSDLESFSNIPIFPDDPTGATRIEYTLMHTWVCTAQDAQNVQLGASNPVNDQDDDIYLKLYRSRVELDADKKPLWTLHEEWNVGRLTSGLDLTGGNPDWVPTWQPAPKTLFPADTGIQQNELTAIVPWGSYDNDARMWLSFDAKGGTFLLRPTRPHNTIRDKVFDPAAPIDPLKVTATFSSSSGDIFVFTQGSGGNTLRCHHYAPDTKTWQEFSATDASWPWGRPEGVFKNTVARINNVVVGMDDTTYFMLDDDRYFTYAKDKYETILEKYAGALKPGVPTLDQLLGADAATLSLQDSIAAGRSLERAFKLPGGTSAVLVTKKDGALGAATVTLDDLRTASTDPESGNSPFKDWDGLDAVCHVVTPQASVVVFSRGMKLAIFVWPSKTWETASLSGLPDGQTSISTAFTGTDGKVYCFCGDKYAELGPIDLGPPLTFPTPTFHSVDTKWGRPRSLFTDFLTSVDGAIMGGDTTDQTLYLFASDTNKKTYCLTYKSFSADMLDSLVVDNSATTPPLFSEVWRSGLSLWGATADKTASLVTAAFNCNGNAYVFAQATDGLYAAVYDPSQQSPFDPLLGPRLVSYAVSFSSDFYARFVLAIDTQFMLSRLTSHTAEQFGRQLFAGGIEQLLALETQQVAELPRFGERTSETQIAAPNELLVDPKVVTHYPGKPAANTPPQGGLDFKSPNGFYYWEIFFHIPYLIAQALRQAQRFDEAKVWYEYIFDPTEAEKLAPAWMPSTQYSVGAMVTNDGGHFYVCTKEGRSGASGGPTGTGGVITDGSVTWSYYTIAWAPATLYSVGNKVTNDGGHVYECTQAGASTGGPTGTDVGIKDGSVTWSYYTTPAWAPSTPYVVGAIVTNDGGHLYKCTAAGTSAASGGPVGTGQEAIVDGSVTWSYVTLAWAPSTLYSIGDKVTNDGGKVYECTQEGTSDAPRGPTGTGAGITDGTVMWTYGIPPYWRFQEFRTYDTLSEANLQEQVDKYYADPFDPHAIAELRPIAYRKAFVMSYLDNVLDWGDQLFRRYTRESIGEATMLYVLVADLLGKRPEELGKRKLDPTHTYQEISDDHATILNDEIYLLENGVPPQTGHVTPTKITTPNDSIFNPYFYIPENEQFVEYWNRVGDRLTKIRNGMDIDGVKRSLALFEPPVDVMALVKAFASGAGLTHALADFNTPVPHYRFSFMLAKARELTGRLISLGSSLLSALEKKDAEELNLLRNTQERAILDLQLKIKQHQLEGATHSLAALNQGLKNAQARETHYTQLIDEGLSAWEQGQIAALVLGQIFTQVSNVLGVSSSVAHFVPQIGSPFAMTYGGCQVGSGLGGLSTAVKMLGDAASFGGSLAGMMGGWDRREQDWKLQQSLATGDVAQITSQIAAAQSQVDVALQEIAVQRRQIKNNESIDTFMRSKFTSQQLYQWMVGKLSAVYFQTYNMALQYAKAAQRAMQFELGLKESDVQYIGVGYWDSLKKGLLSGEQLQLDLDRLEKAHIEANQRRMEITKSISLSQVDPLALVRLKEKGVCEFDLTEALFDGDFPGHYCRQIKTVALSFPAVVGPYDNFNATLTQLAHRTVLSPDKYTVNYLLNGASEQNGSPPSASHLRVDWRPNQQVALSRGTNDSGLFQLNYQDERYLPFEGTGAVSTWRLEVNGVDGHAHRETLSDVIITVQYTALSGGDAFAETVKNAVGGKAKERVWLLNLAYDFPAEWQAFMDNPADGMQFAVERRRLPGATGDVTGVYLHYDLKEDPVDAPSGQSMSLNDDIVLKPGSSKTGLSLPLAKTAQEATKDEYKWLLKPRSKAGAKKFTRDNLKNIALVITYSSKLSF